MKKQTALDQGKIFFSLPQTDQNSKPAVNPSFKVMEEIYATGKTSFFDKLNKVRPPEEVKGESARERPLSRNSVPIKYSQELRKVKKEDVFMNPAAFYLSRKPIAFTKKSREALRAKCPSLPPTHHAKSYSMQMQSNKTPTLDNLDGAHYESFDREVALIPMGEIKDSSSRLGNSSVSAKEKHCEALVNLASYCEGTLKTPTPLIVRQQKAAEKYSKEMDWITEVLQSYGQYKPNILKELYKYTSDSRDDLEFEREKIVQLIKTGAYDPNKNVMRLRARLKKKKNF